jgi:hypothetical protein
MERLDAAAGRGRRAAADQFSYRYRVIRRSAPIRAERIRPFQIDTVCRRFFTVGNSKRMASDSTFVVRRDGQAPAPGSELAGIAEVGDAAGGLIAETRHPGCLLIRAEPPAVEPLENCGILREGRPLANDFGRFAAGRDSDVVPGWMIPRSPTVRCSAPERAADTRSTRRAGVQSHVSVSTLAGPPEGMAEIAAALDAALATGRYDAMIAAARKVRPQ